MKLNEAPFNKIASGTKTIELRLFDEKRQLLSVGDLVIFRCTTTGHECIRRIIALHRATSFMGLLEHINPLDCGWDKGSHPKEEDMYPYYSQEEISTYGVVGIELEKE